MRNSVLMSKAREEKLCQFSMIYRANCVRDARAQKKETKKKIRFRVLNAGGVKNFFKQVLNQFSARVLLLILFFPDILALLLFALGI